MNPSLRNNGACSTTYTYKRSVRDWELRLLQAVCLSRANLEFMSLYVPRVSAPSYTAVSYTWGNDSPSEIIKLDGQVFHVRPNLWSCLYYLGLESRYADWNYLWVDALCIDQENDVERSTQVRYMDETYRGATCVSVWLGLIPIPDELKPLHASFPSPVKTVEADDFDWVESIHDLANREYWSRYWVIQEFLLGKNVRLHCSSTSMNWIDFQELLCQNASLVQFHDEHTAAVPSDDMPAPFAALPLALGRHPDKHPKFLQPLDALLVTHSESKCQDARDRIFALLGLITHDERRLLGRFFPDYTMHLDVVRIVTLAHLMQCGSLENPELRNITPNSEAIFRGLGVVSKPQRMFLIEQAGKMDHLDDGEPGTLSLALEAGILDFGVGANENELVGETSVAGTETEQTWTGERGMGTWTEDAWAENRWPDQMDSGRIGRAKLLWMVPWFLVLGTVGYLFCDREDLWPHLTGMI